MIIKNSVVKIQNQVVNHESQPVKSNPGSVSRTVSRTATKSSKKNINVSFKKLNSFMSKDSAFKFKV